MRAEKTRNVTQRDWPVLTKLWSGKMNIAITEISNIFNLVDSRSNKGVPLPSSDLFNRPKKQSRFETLLIFSDSLLSILLQPDLVNKLMWIS